MTNIKTSNLNGAALDWAVAKIEGVLFPRSIPKYSTNWSQGGPIIERFSESETTFCLFFNPYKDSPEYGNSRPWSAEYKGTRYTAETPLIAAMRCYVASRFGDVVDIPEETTK